MIDTEKTHAEPQSRGEDKGISTTEHTEITEKNKIKQDEQDSQDKEKEMNYRGSLPKSIPFSSLCAL